MKKQKALAFASAFSGASGDTELFEKRSNINGFWLSGNKTSCLYLHIQSSNSRRLLKNSRLFLYPSERHQRC